MKILAEVKTDISVDVPYESRSFHRSVCQQVDKL